MMDLDVENVFFDCLLELDLSYMFFGEFEDIDVWESFFCEYFEQYDFVGFIFEVGMLESLVEKVWFQFNFWELVKYLYGEIVCENRGNSIDIYNNLFLWLVRMYVQDMSLLQVVEVDGFYVVFDIM